MERWHKPPCPVYIRLDSAGKARHLLRTANRSPTDSFRSDHRALSFKFDMHLISLCVLFGTVFLTATASPVELDLYERDLLERRISAKCALCISQCIGYVAACAVACGPGELFGPLGCAVCMLNVLGTETELETQCADRHGWHLRTALSLPAPRSNASSAWRSVKIRSQERRAANSLKSVLEMGWLWIAASSQIGQ